MYIYIYILYYIIYIYVFIYNANIGLITPPPQGQQGQQGLWDPASYQ